LRLVINGLVIIPYTLFPLIHNLQVIVNYSVQLLIRKGIIFFFLLV
jgi:hypothetical protein